MLERYFVLTRLDVQESAAKKELENPGGEEFMKKLAGASPGLPFFAFLDDHGKSIVTSIRPGSGNIGHPVQPQEIAWFMSMLEKAVPQMTKKERGILEEKLKDQPK